MSDLPNKPDAPAADPSSFTEFWPVYLAGHAHAPTRVVHCLGTLAGWATGVTAAVLRLPWLIPVAVAGTYALLWLSHAVFERNNPLTFRHPVWSWLADHKMIGLMLCGRMGSEVRRVMDAKP
jgi:hypothetical protein